MAALPKGGRDRYVTGSQARRQRSSWEYGGGEEHSSSLHLHARFRQEREAGFSRLWHRPKV